MEGHTRMRELSSEVSGHHLLPRHCVRERALSIARRVAARAWGLCPLGPGASEEEEGLGSVGREEGCNGSGPSESEELESGSSGRGERREWKGRIPARRREASFPALPRMPCWCMGMGAA